MFKQRGIALISVLWTVALLALIAASFGSNVRTHGSATRSAAELEAAYALADAGIALAILELLGPQPTPSWRRDGTPRRVAFAGESVLVSIQDEAGKIDLNTADDVFLLGLFRSAGLGASRAEALLDAILDWRDRDGLRRVHGAEVHDYRAAGHDYGPRNAAFESVDEVRLVLGMTPTLFARLEPSLTVHSMRRAVDPVTAPPDLLRSLPEMSAARIEQELTRRAAAASAPAASSSLEGSAGRAYTLRAEWEGRGSVGATRRAVVRLTDDPHQPYWIQNWSVE